MAFNIREIIKDLNRCEPASNVAIANFETQIKFKLPEEYCSFLRITNGGEGFIGEGYCILWPVEELASMNKAYEVHQYVPGLLIFGSDGGGEAFGFDTRSSSWNIVRVPFVGMEWNLAKPMGETFNEFLQKLSEVE